MGPVKIAVPLFSPREIDHVVLRVADLARRLDFPCGALGCTVERQQEAIGLMQLRAGLATP